MYNEIHKQTDVRLWVISDLQQSQPQSARQCITAAVEDFKQLGLECNRILYLGDSVEGSNLSHLNEMAKMQGEILATLGIPLCFVMGNHDLDYYRSCLGTPKKIAMPFWELVQKTPGWKTTAALEDFYFIDDLGDLLLVGLSDHADSGGRWYSSHDHEICGDTGLYPYNDCHWDELRNFIAGQNKKVITFSHYAFRGGNRAGNMISKLFPLPSNVALHLYGHAHIGDTVWAGKDCFRKISWVDGHDIAQIDVASLENLRGNAVRSAFVEYSSAGSISVMFRNHNLRKWEGIYAIVV